MVVGFGGLSTGKNPESVLDHGTAIILKE